MSTLAQLSGRTGLSSSTGQAAGGALPKPRTRGEVVGYAVLGVILLLVIFAIVIKISRRDH